MPAPATTRAPSPQPSAEARVPASTDLIEIDSPRLVLSPPAPPRPTATCVRGRPAGAAFPPLRCVDVGGPDLDLRRAADRLEPEFGDRFPGPVIRQVLEDCRDDLRGSPPAALPELVERLARQRLLDGTLAGSASA